VALALPTVAWSQTRFDYFGHCANDKLPAEKRIEYCNYALSLGSGPTAEIGLLVTLAGIDRDRHDYPKALDLLNRATAYQTLGTSRFSESFPVPGALIGAFEARAEIYALTGQHALALADTEQVFKLVTDEAIAYAARCRIRAVMNIELDVAQTDCNEAFKRNARDAQVLEADGLLQFRLGQLTKAAADYDKALDLNGRLPAALYMRGIIKLRTGDPPGGNADIADAKDRKADIAERFAEIGITP
jgi:tetratricopeptide (TPR) repeat protein